MQSHLWTSFEKEKRDTLKQEAEKLVSAFDLKLIDCESEGGIEVVRSLQEFLSRKPIQSEFNLALLTEAHCLTNEAQNALLKTLEEPPLNSKVILIASSPAHLLPTVVSRCLLRSEIGTQETVDYPWDQIQQVISTGSSQRLFYSENLDLQLWIRTWQEMLYQKLNLSSGTTDFIASLTLAQIQNYLKILMRLEKLQSEHVNPKLLGSVMALSAPKLRS